MSALKRILREPLLHFAVVGVILLGISNTTRKSERAPDLIALSSGDIDSLGKNFERTWQRPPTDLELNGLIDSRVREEVLFREARAMRLDIDDVIVRRRLVQKIEFLTDDLAARRDPTDSELQIFLNAHAKDYTIEQRFSFRQIFFSSNRRGEVLKDDAEAVLVRLQSGAEPGAFGDPVVLPSTIDNEPLSRIARQFGREFADAIARGKTNSWFGPVRTTYGIHLVLVTDIQPERTPSLSEVRVAVERDWRAVQRRIAQDAFYARLRQKYRIMVRDKPYGGDR